MVEIEVTVVDATVVHGLMRRLRLLFDPSAVTYDPAHKRVRVRSEWESRTVIGVVDAVQRWMEESGVAAASLALGTRSYTLLGPSIAPPEDETDPQARSLATISAVVRSTHGVQDSRTLLARVCKSVSDTLGFERVGITGDFTAAEPAEPFAAHGWALHELAEFAASAELEAILSEARTTVALVHTHELTDGAAGAVVAVPLFALDCCNGFLLVDHGGRAFELDGPERLLLSGLGSVVSGLLERALAHDDLLQACAFKSDFISLASHELRTPTAAVCGIATTLHTRGDMLTAQQRRRLSEVLYEQGERLHRLVDQLLDLSRLEGTSIRISPSAVAVRDRTEEIVRGVAAERADEIEIRIDPTLVMQADAIGFDRIVSNLITNALRYGRRPIEVSAASHDRHFRLAVEDRGPGVPRELEGQLFDRFTRGENGAIAGAGLGLAIARAYAHAHGGELLYERAMPHGARFELVVPIATPVPRRERVRTRWRSVAPSEQAS
jgi:K+-sensing histidine kinase KdpD